MKGLLEIVRSVPGSGPDFSVRPMVATTEDHSSPLFDGDDSGAMGNLQIRIFEQMRELEPAWRRLEADNLSSLHQSYDWCNAWARINRNPLALVEGRIFGETVFILPLEIVRSGMVRTAQFIGERFSNINTGLFSASFLEGPQNANASLTMEQVSRALEGRADLLVLRNVPLRWRGRTSPLAALPAVENQNHAFQLSLGADFNETIARLNARKRLKRFRNQVRKFEAAGGYEHVIATTKPERHGLLDAFFAQKSARFRLRGLPNVFQAAETQAFFHLLLETDAPAPDFPLRIHALRLRGSFEGHIAAVAGLSRKGDHVICQFSSIDETVLAEASPGELLFWLMIEQACAEGAALFDFGIGDQRYKRAWCTEETVQHDLLLPLSRLGRLAAIAQKGLTRTKAAIKSKPQVYALVQRLRAQTDRNSTTGDPH